MKSYSSIALILFASSALSQGALTLTVDSVAKTIAWGGTMTVSENIHVPDFTNLTYFLANQETTNPNPSPLKVVTASAGSLTSSVSPTPTTMGNPNTYMTGGEGAINTTHDIGLISVNLGNYLTFDGDRDIAFSVDVSGAALLSYLDFTLTEATFLESLDGEELFFVDRSTGLFVNTVGGGPAILVSVVPEPSSVALLGLGGLLLLRRRR